MISLYLFFHRKKWTMDHRVIHFVGFVTELARKEFIDPWTGYAAQFPEKVKLQEKTEEKAKYKFISRHQLRGEDFNFSFMKGRNSENFSDHKARVIMLGGYHVSERSTRGKHDQADSRVMVMTNKDPDEFLPYTADLRDLSVTIHESFFENCRYSSILEFAAKEKDMKKLVELLKKEKAGEEIAIYRTCRIPAFKTQYS
jgi:hypothetical protein